MWCECGCRPDLNEDELRDFCAALLSGDLTIANALAVRLFVRGEQEAVRQALTRHGPTTRRVSAGR